MAASAAKFAHCQPRYPIDYRSRAPFRPQLSAPLDFAVRCAEIYQMDRELDRAVVRVRDLADAVLDEVAHRPGSPDAVPPRSRRSGPGAGSAGAEPRDPTARRAALNGLRFLGETARFRPPWTIGLLQEAHAVLLDGLDPGAPGTLRTAPLALETPEGDTVLAVCPPDRIRSELGGLLDWVDRYGPSYMPVIPAAVLAQGFYAIRPFPAGNMTVARAMIGLYLRYFGLPNAGLVPLTLVTQRDPGLLDRLMLWTETTGSFTEIVDHLMDCTVTAYSAGTRRWLRRDRTDLLDLDEIAYRLLGRARRSGSWFSAPEAASWVGGRSGATVLRHLNRLVGEGLLEALGKTRAKRYRATPVPPPTPELPRLFALERPARGAGRRGSVGGPRRRHPFPAVVDR